MAVERLRAGVRRGGPEARTGSGWAADGAAARGARGERRARADGGPAAARRRARERCSRPTRPTAISTTASVGFSGVPRYTASRRHSSASSFRPTRALAGPAVREGRALIENAYGSGEVPHPAYAGFSDAIMAPISGATRCAACSASAGASHAASRADDATARGLRRARVARDSKRRAFSRARGRRVSTRLLPDRRRLGQSLRARRRSTRSHRLPPRRSADSAAALSRRAAG